MKAQNYNFLWSLLTICRFYCDFFHSVLWITATLSISSTQPLKFQLSPVVALFGPFSDIIKQIKFLLNCQRWQCRHIWYFCVSIEVRLSSCSGLICKEIAIRNKIKGVQCQLVILEDILEYSMSILFVTNGPMLNLTSNSVSKVDMWSQKLTQAKYGLCHTIKTKGMVFR